MRHTQHTSISAYRDAISTLGERQKKVFEVLIKSGRPLTNTEIAHALNSPINTITPRTNELVAKGLVTEAGQRICTITKKKCIVWIDSSRDQRTYQNPKPMTSEEQPAKAHLCPHCGLMTFYVYDGKESCTAGSSCPSKKGKR